MPLSLFFRFSQPQRHITQTHCISWPYSLFSILPCRSFMVPPTWLTVKSYSSSKSQQSTFPAPKLPGTMPLWTPLPPPHGGRLCIIRPPPSIPCVFYPCRHVLSLVCMTNMSPLNLCWIKDLLWGEKRKRKIWLNNWYFTWENGWMNFRQIIGCLQNRFFLNIPAWRIPWIEEPCGLQSAGVQRIRSNLAHMHTGWIMGKMFSSCWLFH